MALTYLPMLLQQDVNKLYPDILNFDIYPPAHWNGRVSHTFFLKRRGGFVSYADFGGDKVLDFLEFDGHKYGLVKDGNNIKAYKNDTSTLLYTGTYNAKINHSLLLLSACSGAKLSEGTVATSSVLSGVYKITDAAKSWTVNAYAGKYVYVSQATTGQGQAFRILSNDATSLTLERGREVQPTGISYYIFDKFSEVPAIVGGDGLYIVHNDTSVLKAHNFSTLIDATYNLGRVMAVDINDNVVTGYQGYNSLFLDQTSFIGTFSGVKAIVQFQDFVLMLTDTRIGMIKKESVEVVGSEVIDVFKPIVITSLLGAFSKNSFAIYNQGLYLITSAKRFVALNIVPAGTDRYTVEQEDQGGYIQQYLDNMLPSDDISVAINAEKIVITNSSSSKHNIFLYDTYYKFRYRRDTKVPIHGAVVYNDIYYLGDAVYAYNKTYSIDSGANDYTPYLKVMFGESDIFSLKTIILQKYYIGRETSPTTKIKRKAYIDGGVYTAQSSFKDLKYLKEASAYSAGETLGGNILGYGIFGGYGITALDYLLASNNIIEIPTNFTCHLMEIEIEGDLEFGGMILGYEVFEPVITPINSVLGL